MAGADDLRMDLAVDDPTELSALELLVKLAAPGAQVRPIAGTAVNGELGALDVLAIVASSSVLATAIQVLPEFLKSRKPGLSVTVSIKGEDVTVTVKSVDGELPSLTRRLDA